MSVLRPLELRDAPAVFAAADCSRDALRRWMVWYSDAYDIRSAEAWVQRAVAANVSGSAFHFAVCDSDGHPIGVLSFEDVRAETRRAMLGYWLATPATGHGVGTRAVSEALDLARAQLPIEVVWALVADANERSRRVLEANGFRMVEVREKDERGDTTLVYETVLRDPGLSNER